MSRISMSHRTRIQWVLFLGWIVVAWRGASSEIVAVNPRGDDLCPCLTSSTEFSSPNDNNNSSYGIGCAFHNANTTACSTDGADCSQAAVIGPQQSASTDVFNDCQKSWCQRAWCYVDTCNCRLLHRPSYDDDDASSNQARYFSYATCGYMDSFTDQARLASLRGKVLRVAYNANSGGWTGAYHPDGHFATTPQWKGPTVNFVTQAAVRGGFSIQLAQPPEWLPPYSLEFFGTSSEFDLCVYAASLGYVDLCVSDYTITNRRAASTTFFQLQNKPLYLVTFVADKLSSFNKLFAPFTSEVWYLILLLVLPLLGLLMIFHEYGAKDSSFPKESSVLVTDQEGGEEILARKIPMYIHVFRALYASNLGFFQQNYDQRIVTLGGKFNLLGLSFFILIVITLYTSNLAAILIQESQQGEISSLDDAISARYRFCVTRKAAELVMELYDIEDLIVVDPPELGGDGFPGFSCCSARRRVFDFMSIRNSDGSLYCDAAISTRENFDEMQRHGTHCNKTIVDTPIAYGLYGLPMYSAVAEPLASLFLTLRNEGVMRKEIQDGHPTNRCGASTSGEEVNESLTSEDLTAVWVITACFAFLGLLSKCVKQGLTKRAERLKKEGGANVVSVKSMARFDQWGPLGDPVAEASNFELASNNKSDEDLSSTSNQDE